MQIKLFTGVVLIAAAASLAACTTRPVTIQTPVGSGSATIPVPVPATPDNTMTNQVQANLESGMGSNAAGIEVRVEDGTVYLTGQVATRELHNQAVAIARGTPNVVAVVHSGLIVD